MRKSKRIERWHDGRSHPSVGERVYTQDGEPVWWGGVNWYSFKTQRPCRVVWWSRYFDPNDIHPKDHSQCGDKERSI